MHLILDIDGTLIAESETIEEIIERPFLKEFLETVFEIFETVSIWSAASEGHVNKVSQQILPIGRQWTFVRNRKNVSLKYNLEIGTTHCEKRLKNLWKNNKYKNLGFNRKNTLIIDNTPSTYRNNYGNGLFIPTYQGDLTTPDAYLNKLIIYLKTIINSEDIRNVDKKDWYL